MRITFRENVVIAVSTVSSHRLRSLLTVVGIVVGIATVVTVSSLLTGLRAGIVVFFEELGPDNIFIQQYSGGGPDGGGPPKERHRRPIRPEYADAIGRLCPSVQVVARTIFIPAAMGGRPLIVKAGGIDTDQFSIVGDATEAFSAIPRNMESGRHYTAEEDRRGAKVTILGHAIAETLFPDGNAVGRQIMVDGAEYTVVGVFVKMKGGFFGQNPVDSQISIPFRTACVRYPQVNSFTLTAKARPGMRQQAYDEVQETLHKLRHLGPHDPDDFSLSTPDQIVKQFDSVTGMIVMVAIAISALGLLVGGIGVMNIMLVSVTERTREIGVRKAIGARRRDIVIQFLFEAVTLTGIGGIIGIVFAVLVTVLIGALVTSLPSVVPVWALIAGFGVSVGVGIFFGVWPAVKAARLDPVEALRYE
ncbi:MAG TPA: ABC transporter permease [Candidatus Acidoferrales bacterium]|nr:ABC transporter permease [Candidatus Acidoferrales bacterium]